MLPRSSGGRCPLRDQFRPGFDQPFDMVIFAIEQDGIDDLGITIWVETAP
jgi:hypothetical protein